MQYQKRWIVVRDVEKQTAEYVGATYDDTLLENSVMAMNNIGMNVTCFYPEVGQQPNKVMPYGYTHEEGLWDRLLTEYNTKKQEGS